MSDDKTEEIKKNILSASQWTRILFMAFYAVACWVLSIALSFIIVAQILISLITGQDNENLRSFGQKLADYFHDALNFLVYASQDKPWPFDDVDDDDDDDDGSPGVHTEPANDPEPAADDPASGPQAATGDDVFADISFTEAGAEDSAGEEPPRVREGEASGTTEEGTGEDASSDGEPDKS